MPDTIWKFPFTVAGEFEIVMPQLAQVLDVQMQGRTPCLWARLDPTMPNATRYFRIVGTGHDMPDSMEWNADYIGTFQDGPFVWHLFEAR